MSKQGFSGCWAPILKILRRDKIPPPNAPLLDKQNVFKMRTIVVGRGREVNKYASNSVSTAKYTVFNFIPKFLFEQFHRFSNCFFLFIAILQQIPDVTPTNRFGTAFTLFVILVLSATKELFEDSRRRKADETANNSLCLIYDRKINSFVSRKWSEICVGDIIKVIDGESFPADLVLIRSALSDVRNLAITDSTNTLKSGIMDSSDDYMQYNHEEPLSPVLELPVYDGGKYSDMDSHTTPLISTPTSYASIEENGTEFYCYVKTSNVDGESNLKIKRAAHLKSSLRSIESTSTMVKCEEPNKSIHHFRGTLVFGTEVVGLNNETLLLRGSCLQNTAWIIGIVIYTGHDSKIVMNSQSRAPIKISRLEHMTNRQSGFMFGLIILLTLLVYVGYVLSTIFIGSKYYLSVSGPVEMRVIKHLKKIATLVVIFHGVIPTSLIVTMEMVRVYLGVSLENDKNMSCQETGTTATVKTTSLIEELGQVKYILSDKTGTLTRNEMILRELCFNGKTIFNVLEDSNVDLSSPQAQSLLFAMAVCNTAVVKKEEESDNLFSNPKKHSICDILKSEKNPKSHFQSVSPDEVAIVSGANELGVCLSDRSQDLMKVKFSNLNDSIKSLIILAVLEFDSDRKRMSIVLFDENSRKIHLYTKGADSSMWPLLKDSHFIKETEYELNQMALSGLRTLVFATREIPEKEWLHWLPLWKSAQAQIENREEEMQKLICSLEKELTLVGGTGVEDLLQENVPETIIMLRDAGIKIWVLTGDKLETAVNIGYSCCLLTSKTKLITLENPDKILEELQKLDTDLHTENAIAIETSCLEMILESANVEMSKLFMKKAENCITILCCRSSPSQKARVVHLVQKHTGAVCLAVGDGANDVSMIQAAKVGVGMSGKEGMQASRSADFSISEFSHLQRLILVHGSWGYSRMAKMINYIIYKNSALFSCQLCFQTLCLCSGQTLFESWSLSLYNISFTFFLPLLIGTTEKFVSSSSILQNPVLYRFGPLDTFYNSHTFWLSSLNGLVHSIFIFFLSMGTMWDSGSELYNGTMGDIYYLGFTVYFAVIVTVSLKSIFILTSLVARSVAGITLGLCAFFIYIISYHLLAIFFGCPPKFSELVGLPHNFFTSIRTYMIGILACFICLARDSSWKL